MRPARRRAAPRHISPSPMSSEEQSSSEIEEFTANENEIFSEEEDLDQLNESDALSEEEPLDDEEVPLPPKSTLARSHKRKKQILEESEDDEEDDEEEGMFSDEVLRNKPMTKRQRAKAYQEIPEEYLELPMGTGKKKQLTEEEEQLKKSEVARRRKNQSIQRAEKDKADTINRLLKKQASKSKRVIEDNTEDKETAHEKLKRLEDPNRLRYINSAQGSQLSIPTIFTLDKVFGTHQTHPTPSLAKQCQVTGCSKSRKYTAKKSGKFVCSLEHYKMVEVD